MTPFSEACREALLEPTADVSQPIKKSPLVRAKPEGCIAADRQAQGARSIRRIRRIKKAKCPQALQSS